MRAANSVWFVVWLGVTGVAAYLKPSPDGHGTHQELGFPPCPSALLFDRPCPGCGMTTSWTALVHGNLPMAFHAHPLGPVMYFFFTLCAVGAFVAALRGQRLVTDSREFNRVLMVVMLTFLGFGFARMALMDHYRSATEVAWVNVLNAKDGK